MEVPLEELLKLQRSLKLTRDPAEVTNVVTSPADDTPKKKELTTVGNSRPQRPNHLVFKNPKAKLSDPREFAKDFAEPDGGTRYTFLRDMQKKEREELGAFIKSDDYRQLSKEERQRIHKRFQQLTSYVNHKSKRLIKLQKKETNTEVGKPKQERTPKTSLADSPNS